MDTQMEPKRPMALATATLVLQISRDESWDEMTPTEARFGLEAAIGRDKTLRPLQPVVMHEADTFVELQCEVEYGPERGSEGHLLRHLRRQLTSIGEKMGRARCEVFHFSYRTVTADQITAMSAGRDPVQWTG